MGFKWVGLLELGQLRSIFTTENKSCSWQVWTGSGPGNALKSTRGLKYLKVRLHLRVYFFVATRLFSYLVGGTHGQASISYTPIKIKNTIQIIKLSLYTN